MLNLLRESELFTFKTEQDLGLVRLVHERDAQREQRVGTYSKLQYLSKKHR